jgi:hypothetical protein
MMPVPSVADFIFFFNATEGEGEEGEAIDCMSQSKKSSMQFVRLLSF